MRKLKAFEEMLSEYENQRGKISLPSKMKNSDNSTRLWNYKMIFTDIIIEYNHEAAEFSSLFSVILFFFSSGFFFFNFLFLGGGGFKALALSPRTKKIGHYTVASCKHKIRYAYVYMYPN